MIFRHILIEWKHFPFMVFILRLQYIFTRFELVIRDIENPSETCYNIENNFRR